MLPDLPLARTHHPDLDRDALTRTDAGRLAAVLEDPAARVLLACPQGMAVRTDGAAAAWPTDVARDACRRVGEPRVILLAYLGRTVTGPAFALLTTDTDGFDAALAELGDRGDGPAVSGAPVSLREAAAHLTAADADHATTATALASWHATHLRCVTCGGPTQPADAGWLRRCPRDGSAHFPRTDPAVIMAITDAADRVLLGRSRRFPPGRYSCLAGFVEAGESLENAVRREVAEESGVLVGDVEYLGSQPWPFPRSLMVGFHAIGDPDAPVILEDEEISDARWFDVEEVRAAFRGEGDLRVPGPVSIAHGMLRSWVAAVDADDAMSTDWRL